MSPPDSPPHERVAQYRKQAEEALRLAGNTADMRKREELFRMAAFWHGLATELENTLPPSDPPPPSGPTPATKPPARN